MDFSKKIKGKTILLDKKFIEKDGLDVIMLDIVDCYFK